MKEIVEPGRLYDFYGELLTAHQRKVFEEAVYQDLSLTEIASEHGVSKQSIHDLLNRCTKTMQSYENRLHMIRRYQAISSEVHGLRQAVRDDKQNAAMLRRQVSASADRIEEALLDGI